MVTTVTSIVLILAAGKGSDRQLKVSMVTEQKSQSGHTSVDLYIPCAILRAVLEVLPGVILCWWAVCMSRVSAWIC